MPDNRVIELAIKISDRMDRFTPSDQLQFSHAMMNCPCLCARTMKDVMLPGMMESLKLS